MTKLCIKIHMKSDSAIESAFPLFHGSQYLIAGLIECILLALEAEEEKAPVAFARLGKEAAHIERDRPSVHDQVRREGKAVGLWLAEYLVQLLHMHHTDAHEVIGDGLAGRLARPLGGLDRKSVV